MQLKNKPFKVNLFLLGAAKCGTTSLHLHLSKMQEICMSEPKEPFFFECEHEKGNDFYQKKYFKHYQNEPWIGDARHRNLYLPYVPERIHEYNPDAKLLLILRNPTDRAYSHWWHAFSRKYDQLPFEKAIKDDFKRINEGKKLDTSEEIAAYCSKEDYADFYRTYIDSGYYMEQINRYLSLFKREQLHIIFTEDLDAKPKNTLNEIRRFLDLDELLVDTLDELKANMYKKPVAGEKMHGIARFLQLHRLLPSKARSFIYEAYNAVFVKRVGMKKSTRDLLISLYEKHNKELADFTGRDLTHWNK